MNIEFIWDRNSLSQSDTVSSVPCLTEKDMIRESISKTKSRKAARPSSAVSEIVKAAREARVDIITDLVNQVIVEQVILIEWELGTFVNLEGKRRCFRKRKL